MDFSAFDTARSLSGIFTHVNHCLQVCLNFFSGDIHEDTSGQSKTKLIVLSSSINCLCQKQKYAFHIASFHLSKILPCEFRFFHREYCRLVSESYPICQNPSLITRNNFGQVDFIFQN